MKGKLAKLFFWRKTQSEKIAEQIAVWAEYAPKIRQLVREATKDTDTESEGQLIGKMYDFYQNWDSLENTFEPSLTNSDGGSSPDEERKSATPVSVLSELECVPTPFTLVDLDEKISLFNSKSKVTSQRYAKSQIEGFTKRLKNRKKYTEHKDFFERFKNTTDESIDALLKKYKLEINTSDIFVPSFPKEAIQVMEEYTEQTKKVSGEEPVFYVIAEEKDFTKKREKLDPILLVQSPFGFYWQILGAWDKEMLLLSEL